MLSMWGDQAAAPLNIVHLGYGFGAVIANLIVKPYLGEEKSKTLSDYSTEIMKVKESNIKIPYTIASCCCLLITVIHLIFLIIESRNRRERIANDKIVYSSVVSEMKEVDKKKSSHYSPKSCGNGNFSYGLSMSIVLTLYIFFMSGNDQTFGKFFFSFLTNPKFDISKSGATWFMVIYWLSYSVSLKIFLS
jgi:F0F1-type ATP synthase membrane subunit a